MNDNLLLSSFDKLLVGLLYEGAVDALALRLLASCGGGYTRLYILSSIVCYAALLFCHN